MKRFKGKTISNRIIASDIFLIIFVVVSSYFMNWFVDKTYFAIYYVSCSLFFIFLLFMQSVYLKKTTLKPLKKLGNDVAKFNATGKWDKKFVFKDNDIENVNKNIQVVIDRCEKTNANYEGFVSSVTACAYNSLKTCETIFTQIDNGSMLKKKELKEILLSIRETNQKLEILKNIALIDNNHFETLKTSVDIIAKLNEIIFNKQDKILRKRLMIEYDCSSNQIFSKIDVTSFEMIIGNILDVCIALLQDEKEIRFMVDNTQTNFSINITAKDSIISSSLALVLFSDYNLDDIDNVNLLALVLVKKLCLKNDFAFSLNTTHDGYTVFRITKG